MASGDGTIGWIPEGGGAINYVVDAVEHANGLAFTDDELTLYFASSMPGSVHALPLDAAGDRAGDPTIVSDDPSLSVADGLLMAPDGSLLICGFGEGKLIAWTGAELRVVAHDPDDDLLMGVANIAWGTGDGFSPTSLYASNLLQDVILRVELATETR